jgi:hypothetical protein
VDLIDEDDHILGRRELGDDAFEAFLELPAILGTGNDEGQIEGQDALGHQRRRNLAVDDSRRQTLDDRGLAHAGLAKQHRVVLTPAGKHLNHPLQLRLAADQRVENAPLGHFREIA